MTTKRGIVEMTCGVFMSMTGVCSEVTMRESPWTVGGHSRKAANTGRKRQRERLSTCKMSWDSRANRRLPAPETGHRFVAECWS